MKKQLVLGLLGACVLSGNAQTFKEWQDPEINAINQIGRASCRERV